MKFVKVQEVQNFGRLGRSKIFEGQIGRQMWEVGSKIFGGRKIFRGQGGRQILEVGRSKNFGSQGGRQICDFREVRTFGMLGSSGNLGR
jgi:hypothetical protein